MVDVETSYISECSVVFASQSGRMWVRYFHKKTIKWVFNLADGYKSETGSITIDKGTGI